MTSPPQHADPIGETRAQLVQALAVAATVGEAAARWAAVGVQHRTAQLETAHAAQQTAATARQQAAHLAQLQHDQDEQRQIRQAFDDAWLDHASLPDTARLWRTATMRASGGDGQAREAMTRAEARLRQLRPNLMEFYDHYRADGHPPAPAMRAAAHAAWLRAEDSQLDPRPREHPGRQFHSLRTGANGRSLDTGGSAVDEFDAAVRREVTELAAGVDPQILDRLQRQWRSSGLAPAADAAALLAEYARQLRINAHLPAAAAETLLATSRAENLRRQAMLTASTPDDPITTVDEHRAGLDHAAVAHGAADHEDARASQQRRMAQTFTQLTVVQTAHPHLAGKRPATIVSARQRGRAR